MRIFARHILFLSTGHFRIFFLLFSSAVIFLPFPVLCKEFQLLCNHVRICKIIPISHLFNSNAASKTLGVCFSPQFKKGKKSAKSHQKKTRGKLRTYSVYDVGDTKHRVLYTLCNVRARAHARCFQHVLKMQAWVTFFPRWFTRFIILFCILFIPCEFRMIHICSSTLMYCTNYKLFVPYSSSLFFDILLL